MKYFAIGDIHGCADELKELVARLPLDDDSTLVFLGDYIDRGPDAKGVIEFLIQLKKKYRVVTLKGNHESMMEDFLEHPESAGAALFVLNGGSSTLASYSEKEGQFTIPDEHLQFLRKCPRFFETEDYFFVHAGLRNQPLENAKNDNDDVLLWIRDAFLKSDYDWGKLIIHGHTPVDVPTIKKNRINIDTGCVFGGCLTAIEMPAGKIYQISVGRKISPRILKDEAPQRRAKRFTGAVDVFVTKNSSVYAFETLNYNEFGLLMRENHPGAEPLLQRGEVIEGVIGQNPHAQIRFRGEVMRADSRGEAPLYGVKIEILPNLAK